MRDTGGEDERQRASPVRKATGPRYGRGHTPGVIRRASETGDPIYQRVPVAADGRTQAPPPRSNLQSLLTSLPILMLLVGLWVFYRNEGAQTEAGPLLAESEQLVGQYQGVSQVRSGGSGRHYLWLRVESGGSASAAQDGARRGFRLLPQHAAMARQQLTLDDDVIVDVAPTVAGSETRWLWRLAIDDLVLIDDSERLR